MAIEIVEAAQIEPHLARLADISQRAYAAPPWRLRIDHAELLRTIASLGSVWFFLARRDSDPTVAGFSVGTRLDERSLDYFRVPAGCGVGAGDYHLTWRAVDPEAQGRGLGSALIDARLEQAAALGCRHVLGDTHADNAPTLEQYRRRGFEVCYRRRFTVYLVKSLPVRATWLDHPDHPRLRLVRVADANLPADDRDLADTLRAAVADRRHGGVIVERPATDPEEMARWYLTLAGAIGEVLEEDQTTDGRAMPAQGYVTIALGNPETPAPEMLHFADPRLPWPLHTDRALKVDPGDFLLVAKSDERDGSGGAIRLLHLDDLARLGEFLAHPLAFEPLQWKPAHQLAPPAAQAALRRQPGVPAPVFENRADGPCIRLTDHRFRRPGSMAQAEYLDALDDALRDAAERMPEIHLPVGSAYVVNNRFVLHGRAGFRPEAGFRRALLRYCGRWRPS